jgi:hypothetical protein
MGLEFSFSAPDRVEVMQEFDVDIGVTNAETYDTKIFFKADADDLKSEIEYGDGWKNAYYYLRSSFPEQHIYTIRLVQFSSSSNVDLCVRLRKPNQTSYSEECKDMEISNQVAATKVEEEKQEPKRSKSRSDMGDPFQPEVQTASPVNESILAEEPIILRRSQSSSLPAPSILTSQGKTRIIINYILALVVILALFLIIRRKNSEF